MLSLPSIVLASTKTLNPVDDTYIDAKYPNVIYGAYSYLSINYVDFAFTQARALLKFDLSQIPSSSNINSAKVRLYQNASTGASSINLELFRLSGGWSEGSTSWSNQSFHTNESYSSVLSNTSSGYKEWDVTNLVKKWKDGTYSNDGVIIMPTNFNGAGFSRGFATKEFGSNKPELVVDYTPIIVLIDGDNTHPEIYEVKSSDITQNSVKISWKTNENADTWVDYGTSSNYGFTYGFVNALMDHSLDIGGLASNSTYHFRVHSKDPAGNQTSSSDFNFKTLASSSSPTPSPSATATPKTSIKATIKPSASNSVKPGSNAQASSESSISPSPSSSSNPTLISGVSLNGLVGALMGLALFGLIAVIFYYLRKKYRLKIIPASEKKDNSEKETDHHSNSST